MNEVFVGASSFTCATYTPKVKIIGEWDEDKTCGHCKWWTREDRDDCENDADAHWGVGWGVCALPSMCHGHHRFSRSWAHVEGFDEEYGDLRTYDDFGCNQFCEWGKISRVEGATE